MLSIDNWQNGHIRLQLCTFCQLSLLYFLILKDSKDPKLYIVNCQIVNQ